MDHLTKKVTTLEGQLSHVAQLKKTADRDRDTATSDRDQNKVCSIFLLNQRFHPTNHSHTVATTFHNEHYILLYSLYALLIMIQVYIPECILLQSKLIQSMIQQEHRKKSFKCNLDCSALQRLNCGSNY